MKVLTDMESYEDIADAIREKNGETTLYKPREMAGAIRALSIGDPDALTYMGTLEDVSGLPEEPENGDLYIVGESTVFWSATDSEWVTLLYDGVSNSQKGVAGGVATLDQTGKVPTAQLPALLALGETTGTAYRGDRGKAAYDHAQARGSQYTGGLYKIATNAEGHVTEATAVSKTDITDLGIPAQDTTYHDATAAEHGLMSTADKSKLDGIEANATANAASTATPQMDGTASAGSATEYARGDHVHPTDDTRASKDVATTSTNGLMSATDKAKLDGIESQATKDTAYDSIPLMDGTGSAGTSGTFARGDHRHPTDTTRAPLTSPAFTGTPTAPTAASGTNTTQVATTAFVRQEISGSAYELPTMSATVKGGAKLGDGLALSGEVLAVDWDQYDGVTDVELDGTPLQKDTSGTVGISTGNGLSSSAGTIDVIPSDLVDGSTTYVDNGKIAVDLSGSASQVIDGETLVMNYDSQMAVNIDESTLSVNSDGYLAVNASALAYGSTQESYGKIVVVAGTAISASDSGVSVEYDEDCLDVNSDNELTLNTEEVFGNLADGETTEYESGKLSVRYRSSGGMNVTEDGLGVWLHEGGGLLLHYGSDGIEVDDKVVLLTSQVATSEEYVAESAHDVGEYIMYDGLLYVVTDPIDVGDYTIEKVTQTTIADVLSNHERRITEAERRLDTLQSLRRGADGYYINESVTAWLARRFDGKIYGYSEPKTTAVQVTKTGANAGLENPTLGTLDTEGRSAYRNLGPFQWYACKGHVDADGVPHVKVIRGVDTLAEWNACTEDVWSMRPVVYYSIDEDGGVSVNAQLSDTWHQGMRPNPRAYLPDGTLRPYMLAARHGLGFENGVGVSKPGLKGYGRNVSHNSLITLLSYANSGYSGKTEYEQWYDAFMFRMIYGTKDSQSVMRGCSSYNLQYHPAIAETGVKRVILTNAQAANLVVGSTMMMGNQATVNTDRNNANAYNVFDGLVISSIETYDSANKAVYFDTDATFDTDPAYLLSTAPWHTGSCGDMDWDGTPTAAGATSGKEPMFFQGCELMNGNYEVLGDVIISSDGSTGWIPYVNPDTKGEKTALSSGYVSCETSLPVDSADSWKYPLYLSERNGMMYGIQTGGSQSMGICDGHYTNKVSTAGTREWLALGGLDGGGRAGLACVSGGGLGYAHWSVWSRLSGVGRSRFAA